MVRDITALVIRAQDARTRMQEAKKRNKADVKRKYEAMMRTEIATRDEDAEYEFARILKEVHDAGVPQSTLRREVLRTNVWGEWTKWRDLAEIPPQRVAIRNAKAEAEAARLAALPYRLVRDADNNLTGVVEFIRDMSGETMPAVPVRYMASAGKLRWTLVNIDDGLSGAFTDSGKDGTVYARFGGSEGVERFWTFVSDSIQTGGDYNEMLAWAKAVKK